MRPITEVKELRQIQIAILDQVVAFCDENGINYSLAGGTLIGALRHKGYIPWDDDIDLYLPREETELSDIYTLLPRLLTPVRSWKKTRCQDIKSEYTWMYSLLILFLMMKGRGIDNSSS